MSQKFHDSAVISFTLAVNLRMVRGYGFNSNPQCCELFFKLRQRLSSNYRTKSCQAYRKEIYNDLTRRMRQMRLIIYTCIKLLETFYIDLS